MSFETSVPQQGYGYSDSAGSGKPVAPYAVHDGYAVHQTHDEYGRSTTLAGITLDKRSAETMAKGHGWYGGDGEVRSAHILEIRDPHGLTGQESLYFLLNAPGALPLNVDLIRRKNDQVKAAKAKLIAQMTPEELALLNIKL